MQHSFPNVRLTPTATPGLQLALLGHESLIDTEIVVLDLNFVSQSIECSPQKPPTTTPEKCLYMAETWEQIRNKSLSIALPALERAIIMRPQQNGDETRILSIDESLFLQNVNHLATLKSAAPARLRNWFNPRRNTYLPLDTDYGASLMRDASDDATVEQHRTARFDDIVLAVVQPLLAVLVLLEGCAMFDASDKDQQLAGHLAWIGRMHSNGIGITAEAMQLSRIAHFGGELPLPNGKYATRRDFLKRKDWPKKDVYAIARNIAFDLALLSQTREFRYSEGRRLARNVALLTSDQALIALASTLHTEGRIGRKTFAHYGILPKASAPSQLESLEAHSSVASRGHLLSAEALLGTLPRLIDRAQANIDAQVMSTSNSRATNSGNKSRGTVR